VDTILGLLGLTVFVACVIALAAGITWLVVKVDQWVRRLRQTPTPTPET
jgi:hypothetical protein